MIGHGLDVATPVVVVAGLSRPDEAHWQGTLAGLKAGLIADQGVIAPGQPVLIGIGRAFGASAQSGRGHAPRPVAGSQSASNDFTALKRAGT